MKSSAKNRNPHVASSPTSPSVSGKHKKGKGQSSSMPKSSKLRDKIQKKSLKGRRSHRPTIKQRKVERRREKMREKTADSGSDDDDSPDNIQIGDADGHHVKNAVRKKISNSASKQIHAKQKVKQRDIGKTGAGSGSADRSSNKRIDEDKNTSGKSRINSKHHGQASVAPSPPQKVSVVKFSPHIERPKIDRLAVTVWTPDEQRSKVLFAARDLELKANRTLPQLVYKEPKKGQRYRHAYVVKDDKGKSIGYITFDPLLDRLGFLRFDYNPAGLTNHQLVMFHHAIKMLLGAQASDLLARARITLIDIAIDVLGIPRSAILTYSLRLGRSGIYGKWFNKGDLVHLRLETAYHGQKKSSPRSVTVYDKRQERLGKGVEVGDYDWVRFEARSRPGIKQRGPDGKFTPTRGPRLHELRQVANPFGNFRVAAYPLPVKGDWEFDIFLAATESIGVDAAMAKVTDETHRRRYRQRLVNARADWWNPENVMEQVVQALIKLDLFPYSAFISSPDDDE